MKFRLTALITALLMAPLAVSQEQPAAPAEQPPATSRPMTPYARLHAARTVWVENGGGNTLPYNIISSAFEAWPRFVTAKSRQKADLVVVISAPEEDSGVSISSSTLPNSHDGRTEDRMTTSRSVGTVATVKMQVFSPGVQMPIWSSAMQPKGGVKTHTREDHLAEAAQKLFERFHDMMEPPVSNPDEGSGRKK